MQLGAISEGYFILIGAELFGMLVNMIHLARDSLIHKSSSSTLHALRMHLLTAPELPC